MINYNPQDKAHALQLASELKFEAEDIKELHCETLISIFTDDDGGTWEITGTYRKNFNLCYDGDLVEKLSHDLNNQIDEYCRDQRNSEYNEKHEQEQFNDFQQELWRNYGPGKN